MTDIIIKKIDNILEKSGDKLLHIPSSETGMYFEKGDGIYGLSHILATKQAYITGLAIRAYVATKNRKYIDWCYKFFDEYYDKVGTNKYDTTSDVGMLYSFYAVSLYKITGDEKMKKLALLAADEVARRFYPNFGYIKSWGRANGNIPPYVDSEMEKEPFFCENRGLVLIESTINLLILYWAADETRQYFYSRIAESHIANVKKYLIRGDYTTCHGYRFDESKHIAYREENYFGNDLGSYWAKGAAVAIYSFAHLERYAENPQHKSFWSIAYSLLNTFIDYCKGKLPVWDFEAKDAKVDTCSAAIVLCAIREIKKYAEDEKIDEFESMLSEELKKHLDTNINTDGILKNQNGKDEYDIMGDYFIAEAFLPDDGTDII